MLAPSITSIELDGTFCAWKFDRYGWLCVAFLKHLCERFPPKIGRYAVRRCRGGFRSRGGLGGRFRRGKALAGHGVSPHAQTIGCGQFQNGCEIGSGTPEIV